MQEFANVLNKNEKTHWEGRPKFLPFLMSGAIMSMIIGLIFIVFLIPMTLSIAPLMEEIGYMYVLILLPLLVPGIFFIIVAPIYQILVHRHIYYAITDKRIILQKGLIGIDFEIVDFYQVTNAEVNVGAFDKLFVGDSGSILISTAGSFTYGRHGPIQRPYVLRNIENPYAVFRFFKDVAHAVKTDIQFPNKYRPDTNPGYNTNYTSKNDNDNKRQDDA